MFNSLEFIIVACIIALMFIFNIVLFISVRTLRKKCHISETNLSSNELLVNQLQTLFVKLDKQVKEQNQGSDVLSTELTQVTKQLEHRIKSIQEDITKLQNTQVQHPEDKLYSRAFKMVELGADADELVRECDIPKAEADMLISIHKKQHTP